MVKIIYSSDPFTINAIRHRASPPACLPARCDACESIVVRSIGAIGLVLCEKVGWTGGGEGRREGLGSRYVRGFVIRCSYVQR